MNSIACAHGYVTQGLFIRHADKSIPNLGSIMFKHINEVAMLVHTDISFGWHGHRSDPRIREAATRYYHLADDAVIGGSRVIYESDCLDQLNRVIRKARRSHYGLTLCWSNGGERLLTNQNFSQYFTEINRYQSELERLKPLLVEEFDGIRGRMMVRLGDLAAIEDYPPVSEILQSFNIRVDIKEIPETSDIRLMTISRDMRDKIIQDRETAVQGAIKHTLHKVYEQLELSLVRIGQRSDTENKSLVAVTIDNVNGLRELFEPLNLTQDPEFDELAEDIVNRLIKSEASRYCQQHPAEKNPEEVLDDVLRTITVTDEN